MLILLTLLVRLLSLETVSITLLKSVVKENNKL